MVPTSLDFRARAFVLCEAQRAVHFACPACSSDLVASEAGLSCANGHSVNVAREGHVHLLPPMRRPPAVLRESDEIVRAAHSFHLAGGFAAQASGVAEEVSRAVAHCSDGQTTAHVLNVGCGTGHYLRVVAEHLLGAGRRPELWGIDQSKLAVRLATKQARAARLAVASPHRLPFADGSFDCVFSVFAPAPWEEFCRVLRPGGAVVVARPGSRHLSELRSLAGDSMPRPPKQTSAVLAENYARVCTSETYEGDAASNLLNMTPFVRTAPLEKQRELRRLAATTGIRTHADIILSTHRVWLGTANGLFER